MADRPDGERPMDEPPMDPGLHEPGLPAVELLCERLGELGLPIGPDTAREILRSVLAAEAPRIDAHLRDALQTSLDTIRIAAQAGLGVLRTTAPLARAPEPRAGPKPVLDPAPAPSQARRGPGSPPTPRPAPARRSPPPRRDADPDDDPGGEQRPVFRRPRR